MISADPADSNVLQENMNDPRTVDKVLLLYLGDCFAWAPSVQPSVVPLIALGNVIFFPLLLTRFSTAGGRCEPHLRRHARLAGALYVGGEPLHLHGLRRGTSCLAHFVTFPCVAYS